MKKILLIIVGTVSVVLGVTGIFLPILPTTPFLLLASYCFLKSSSRLYNWLMDHPVLGFYVKSYIKYRGVEKRYKILSISLLWLTMLISIYIVKNNYVRLLLLAIAIGVTTHILKLRTLSKEEVIELEKLEKETLEGRVNRENYS